MKKDKGLNIFKLITASFIGLMISFPLIGFIYGLFACRDCGNVFTHPIGRIFIGIVEAVLTTITLGKPWDNEGGTSSTNLRLYVLLTAIIIAFLIHRLFKRYLH